MVETGKYLEFFKVFLPEFSSYEMVIPPAFIDILNKPLPNEAFLLDEIGRLWNVETKTEETEERVCVLFKKGWETFAKDQSLEFGDFLVFSYDGDMSFSVTIFAQDGCKKDLGIVTTKDKSRVSLQKKPVRCFTKPKNTQDFGNKVTQKRKYDSAKKDPSVLVKDKPECVSAVKIEPEYQEITRRKVNRDGDDLYDVSWALGTKHKGFEEEPVYKPKNPHFVRTMNPSSLQRLEIPPSLLKSNGITLEEDIEICDENGKKWPMKTITYRQKETDGALRLSHDSWVCFCKSHKLKPTNKCVFEFIVGSNGRCSQIEVRIFRGRLPTRSTKSRYYVVDM